MITMNQCLVELVKKRLIDVEEAFVRCTDPEEFTNLLQKAGIQYKPHATRAV